MKSEQDFEKSVEESIKSQSQLQSQSSLNLNSETQMTAAMIKMQQMYNQLNKMTEDDVNTIKRIFSEFRDFKINQENKIEIANASRAIIAQTLGLWKKRPIKHPNYTVVIVLTTPKVEKQKILEDSEPFASIKWIIDGEQIQNKKAIHKLENGAYYQGIDGEFMMITKINGDVMDYYEGDTKDFVEHGKGYLNHTVQGKGLWQYSGEFVNGKRQGHGKEMSGKGISYEGDFKDDFKHGKGLELVVKKRKHPQPGQEPYLQKNRYLGEFKMGYKQGTGIQITPHGQYQGQWHQGMKHGKGILKYKKGDVYQGQWQNNCQHGQGIYKQLVIVNDEEKFNVYTGEFKEGFYHGKGVMEYYNGDKYDGEWALGKKDGAGMYEWSDGDYYDGQWEKDSAEGTGAACFGGVFYDGEFHLGEKHGLGEETDADGNTTKAMWQGGKIIKKLQFNGQIVEEQEEN